ncbi:hypothetical protein [Streptomyces sp. NBC_00842]|uniref:hypothetical protein n=1 Tax=Streptomyces sp. NBC_00842 TaxID=2975848 RepID=UPI002F909822|nr:hypothetical protein OH821_44980 [Streptomyces sp. NBC_00842]
MATSTQPLTPANLISRYAADIAFVAEEQPATTVSDFTYQLGVAAENFEAAGIDGGDELEAGAQYLADGNAATDDTTRAVLLGKAAEYLARANGMADEYRDMV